MRSMRKFVENYEHLVQKNWDKMQMLLHNIQNYAMIETESKGCVVPQPISPGGKGIWKSM